jgi:DNA/RNA endonuclease YhcR with UshA esterase domain
MRRFLPFFFIFVLSTGHLLSADEGKTVEITGIIKLYREKPEIKITSKDQIVSE